VPQHASAFGSGSHGLVAKLAAVVLAGGLLAACAAQPEDNADSPVQTIRAAVDPSAVALPAPKAVTVPPLKASRLRPDVLVSRRTPMSATEMRRLVALAPAAVAFASGTVQVDGRDVRVASVDPLAFRRFAPARTAESTALWQVVASGGLIAAHDVATRLGLPLGEPVLLNGKALPVELRLGGLATLGIPGTDFIVDQATGRELGLSGPTSVLLTAGPKSASTLAAKARGVTGDTGDVQLLNGPAVGAMAFLTGSSAAKAFGAFSYTYFSDGTIQPDAAWVRNNIVSATVPIFGRVTCHRLMVPQLRGALQDVVNAGLASSLHTYNGCYVPRFIERNPSRSVSLHTWGIAIDLDSATNYRGIAGTMDPRVVTIFKRWGFRWGGDWSYTDPMHFELGALMTERRRG
jgi:hypothetical protein